MRDSLRPMRIFVLLLVGAAAFWLALPSVASSLIERWLERQGYADVVVRFGYPGWRMMSIPTVTLKQKLTGEIVMLSLKDSSAQYTVLGLLAGRIDRIVFPELSIEIRTPREQGDAIQAPDEDASPDAPASFVNVLTTGDLVQGLPLLPCDEVQIGRLTIFREQATGPLQTVTLTGTIKQQRGELQAEMLLQGADTMPYELRMTSQSASDMLLQLRALQPHALPIVLWRSQVVRKDSQVQLKGVVEVNIHELAPFMALAVPIGSEWQQVSGSVTVNWAGTAASSLPVTSLWTDPGTEVQATVQLGMTLPELKGFGQDIAVNMTGTLSGNATRVHWSMAPGTLVTAMVNAKKVRALKPVYAAVPSGPQPFRIESVGETKGELFWTESPPHFAAVGPLAVSYGSAKGPTRLEVVATRAVGQGREIHAVEGNFHAEGILPSAMIEGLSLGQTTGDLRGTMMLSGTEIRGTILPPSSVTTTRFQKDLVTLARGTVQLTEALPVRFNMATGMWGAGPSTVTLRVPRIKLAEYQLMMEQAAFKLEELKGSAATWKGQGTAILQDVAFVQPASRSVPTNLTVRITADPTLVKADVQGHTREQTVTLAAQIEHALATGRGTLHGGLGPVTFNRAGFRLRQLITPWPYPVDVTEGRLSATFDVAWGEDGQDRVQVLTGSTEVAVDNVAGRYRDIILTGLSTKLKVSVKGLESIVTSHPAEFKIVSINAGVDVTNVAMTAQVDWNLREALPVVEVRDIRCDVLGGVVTSQGVRANLAHPSYGITLLVRQLDLQKVLSLEQQKGLQGTGLLDGTVPVTVTSRGVTVKDGLFEARPPGGVIRYVASAEATRAVTQANANMQVVLQTLNNFHYNVLQVGAQYAEDGTLNLKVRLEGKNPDQKKSPPIHFNLAVQENIPALLKSLRLVQDIEESVQKQFKRP